MAYRKVGSDSLSPLGTVPGGTNYSMAYGASSDGSVIVGYDSIGSDRVGFRWALGSGMAILEDLSGGTRKGEARGVTPNGTVIVGFGTDGTGQRPVRWVWPSSAAQAMGGAATGSEFLQTAASSLAPQETLLFAVRHMAGAALRASWRTGMA